MTDYTTPREVLLTIARGDTLKRRAKRRYRDGKRVKKSMTRDEIKALHTDLMQDVYQCQFPEITKISEASDDFLKFMQMGGDEAIAWCESILEEDEIVSKSVDVEVSKVDETLGIVFGYAIICKIDGEDYYDVQGDHIPEPSMLEATFDYMKGERIAKDMHRGEQVGQIVFGFPLTSDIAKSLGLAPQRTGFLVGMKPEGEEMLAKFASGEYTGFSIGGRRIEQTEE